MLTKKAQNLKLMRDIGLKVPYFRIITETMSETGVSKVLEDEKFVNETVSIRSSGSVSCPGLMKTFLNVNLNTDNARHYINSVFESGRTENVINFIKSKGEDPDEFIVEVIIQTMIPVKNDSDWSGVILAKNNSKSLYLEYAHVHGDQLMSGGISPAQRIIEKNDVLYSFVERIRDYLPGDLEIEIVYSDGVYYFLQVRQTIIESYPKLTVATPLTARFALNINQNIFGKLTRDIDDLEAFQSILFTDDTAFYDVEKIKNFQAIVTTRGGATCHAAAIARMFNIPTLIAVEGSEFLNCGSWYLISTDGKIKFVY